ncbi:ASCH domain-containing protein [Ruminococcus sp.]|uniref:ASCH domain-containing protein n=1 Tax=Ruminococcus sp. TaxID=41978 RepID=UPI0026177CE9|nr:ASCH domain-containing protein [Ruminococcus sp.]MDD6989564.1 ASCH domain-containing protein [Ruminococcus sp.]MDY6201758.1 ASCH domain-containing protein [Ruminococcus sp.]
MCSILLSIKPEFVKSIFSGKKEYEFRKIKCKRDVERIIIYSTNPVKLIVGEAKIETVLEDDLDIIWSETKNKAGIDKEFFDEYYNGKNTAIAYKLSNVIQYKTPKSLEEYGLTTAPQSFCYID